MIYFCLGFLLGMVVARFTIKYFISKRREAEIKDECKREMQMVIRAKHFEDSIRNRIKKFSV